MGKSKSIRTTYQPFARERGVAVPASSSEIMLPDGSTAFIVGIDLSKAMCPDRSYPAELAGVVYENGIVKLLFGQATLDGGVRSLVEVSMSPQATIQALTVIEELKNPSLEDIFRSTGEEGRTLTEFKIDPPDVARLKANMLAIGLSGSEACIDFYDLSSFAKRNLQIGTTETANVLGVVRIDTQTALVHALILKIKELTSRFPSPIN